MLLQNYLWFCFLISKWKQKADWKFDVSAVCRKVGAQVIENYNCIFIFKKI